jgi:hypothetical protein
MRKAPTHVAGAGASQFPSVWLRDDDGQTLANTRRLRARAAPTLESAMPHTCTVDGCDEVIRAGGLCRLHLIAAFVLWLSGGGFDRERASLPMVRSRARH